MPNRARSGEVSKPGPGRRADEREPLHRHLHRPRARPLADDDVELVVLHRRIEDLFDGRAHAVHFVDEEHLAHLERRQHRRQIAGLFDDRAGRRSDRHAELVGDHVGKRGLAEPGRTVQQHVIERLAPLPGRGNRDVQIFADAILADVLVERPRPQPGLVLDVFGDASGGDDAIVGAILGCTSAASAASVISREPGTTHVSLKACSKPHVRRRRCGVTRSIAFSAAWPLVSQIEQRREQVCRELILSRSRRSGPAAPPV